MSAVTEQTQGTSVRHHSSADQCQVKNSTQQKLFENNMETDTRGLEEKQNKAGFLLQLSLQISNPVTYFQG